MSQTVIELPDEDGNGSLRLLLVGHRVDVKHIIVDRRSDLFGRWLPVHRSEYRHRIEGNEDDEGRTGCCRCCGRDMAAADSDQTDASSEAGVGGAVPEPSLSDLHSRCYASQVTLSQLVDKARSERDWAKYMRDRAEQQVVELRAEVARLQGGQHGC